LEDLDTNMPGTGKVISVVGPVVDVAFESDSLPSIYNAIEIRDVERGVSLVCEVAQHLGDNVVRTIALASTDGLVRGMEAFDSGAPISVPVGNVTLGRVFNVLGKPIDNGPAIVVERTSPIHRNPPRFDEQFPSIKEERLDFLGGRALAKRF
jgi:F-type H+-transporting ATPase subunit beta